MTVDTDLSKWGIDPAALAAWLEAAGERVSGGLVLRRIGTGQSNLVLLGSDEDGSGWIIRRPPLGRLLETAHDIPREGRILRALRASPVPVPQVIGLVDEPAVSAQPCLVMQRVDGFVVDDEAVAETLEPARRRTIAEGLVDVMVALHSVDPADVGLDGLAVDAPYAARQLRRWTRQWESTRPAGPHPLDSLTARLEQAQPSHEERRIVHGDLHLKNLIFGNDGLVAAVLDWELATLGDPVADLGTLLAYWPDPGEGDSLVFGVTRLPGFPNRSELVSRYRDRSGRAAESVDFWHVMGLWKLTIIAQGVLRRTQGESRNRADGAPAGQGDVDRIAIKALSLADQLQL